MNEKSNFLKYTVIISITWLLIGLTIGWTRRGSYNEKELRESVKEEFVKSVTWAIQNDLLIVNSNKLSELESNKHTELPIPNFGVNSNIPMPLPLENQ